MNDTPQQSFASAEARWSSGVRIGFRFIFLYLGLFSLVSQVSSGLVPVLISGPSGYAFRNPGQLWPFRAITSWMAGHVFRADAPVASGAWDSTFLWAQSLWILGAATAGAILWSIIDRKRENDVTLWRWFTLFIRMGLGAQILFYGIVKIIPAQFPPPSLVTLVTPVSQLSLADLLWTSIGASPAYQVFIGLVETVAGALLLIPATATLGAAVSFAVMAEVLVLNLTYDADLKQLSFHLWLMSACLLAPLAWRAVGMFVGRQTYPWGDVSPFRTVRGRRLATVIQIAFGLYLATMYGYVANSWWRSARADTASPFYGIWNVRRFSVNGQSQRAVLDGDNRRWRRLIFETPGAAVLQRSDDSLAQYAASVDTARQTLGLAKPGGGATGSRFTYRFPAEDRLILDGEMDNHAIRMELDRVDLDTFRLINGGFRWIRPADPGAIVE